MFLDLSTQGSKAKFASVLQSILKGIVSQFHFFTFQSEFAVKHMIIQTKHGMKKYLKVRPTVISIQQ